MSRTTVAYILASSRSGSTLLERMLARSTSVTAAGELVHLWTRGLRDDEPCGCGLPFSACARWRAVGDRAFGGWATLEAERQIELQRSVDRQRYLHRILLGETARSAKGRRYLGQLGQIYEAIGSVAGTKVVIDSSKHASTLFLLRDLAAIELFMVHLVRDPRGVVNSWSRPTARPEAPGAQMHRVSSSRATARWFGRNLQGELAARKVPSVRIRYEDLVADPEAALGPLAARLGLELPPMMRPPSSVKLGVDHTVAGNPMRFQTGAIQLKLDQRWQRDLDPVRRRMITTTTWPLRHVYDYSAAGYRHG